MLSTGSDFRFNSGNRYSSLAKIRTFCAAKGFNDSGSSTKGSGGLWSGSRKFLTASGPEKTLSGRLADLVMSFQGPRSVVRLERILLRNGVLVVAGCRRR